LKEHFPKAKIISF